MQALFNQAQTFHQNGQLDKAEAAYRQVLDAAPMHPVVNARLALVYQQMGRMPEALSRMKDAISAAGEEVELLKQGGQLAAQSGENELAERWLSKAMELDPANATVMEQLAGVLVGVHQEERALDLSKKLIRLDPKSANAYNIKGLALSRLGQTDKGYKAFQKALKLNPGLLSAVRNLVLYGKGKQDSILDGLIPQLESNYQQKSQPPQVQMNIAYILSMYFEKKGQADKTFQYLKDGNDLNRKANVYSHQETEKLFQQIAAVFDESLVSFAKEKAASFSGVEDPGPIFILGMPRSGTTLIEQILSSHSLVDAEGEILDMRMAFDSQTDVMTESLNQGERLEAIKQIGEAYIESLRSRQKATYFTDKMPYNFMMIGAIALALPNAKIIHCTRDPLETCFSIYKQNFAGAHGYTNNLEELGLYYREYQALMAHWSQLFGDRIYEANYERMVEDSESEIKRLLSYCKLEEEAACFKFYQNKRAVRTASVAQVRQPIYKKALKASDPYSRYLEPLKEALQG